MRTLTWSTHSIMLKKLKRVFPRLWIEHQMEFHQFFHTNGKMNKNGRRAYAILKVSCRKRMRQ